jgi:guanine deaminase
VTTNVNAVPLKPQAYRGTILHALSPQELAFFPDGVLVVNQSGQVVACDHWEQLQASGGLNGVTLAPLPADCLIIPGLVDAHVHLPQMAVAGFQAETLLAWLETHIFAEESRFEDDAYAQSISEWFFSALLANGTTMAAVFLTSHPSASQIAFETAERLGNRVIMGQNLMDANAPSSLLRPTRQLLQETEALCQTWHGKANGRLQYAWVPRFALTSTETLLAGIGTLRQKYPDVYLHTHLSEQLTEIEAVKSQFPWAEDYTGVYERFGLLGPRTILAHGIHLSDGELTRLHALDASLAHCPSSNFFLKSGRFRLIEVLNRRLRLGLGSDVGAGPELSLFKVMKDAQYIQSDVLVPLKTLFYLSTLGGAVALDQQNRIGNFELGKEADFLVLTLPSKSCLNSPKIDRQARQPEDLLSALVYQGDDRLVEETYIRGQRVYRRLSV